MPSPDNPSHASDPRPDEKKWQRWQFFTAIARLAAVLLELLDDYINGRGPGRLL